MSRRIRDTFGILLEPHELASICESLRNKLFAHKGTYLHEKRYYLADVVRILSIAPHGTIARTNHLISFQVTALVRYVRPLIGDVVCGTVTSITKDGMFVQTDLYKSIVPTRLYPVVRPCQVGSRVTVRIEDLKFSSKHIYTISSVVEVEPTTTMSTSPVPCDDDR